jgi:transcriptional regulator with XRE-family HTH domain
MHIGKKIKLSRVAKGWTQQDLADKIHKARPLISHIEKTGDVNAETLRKIFSALDISENSDADTVLEMSGIYTKGKPGSIEYYRQEIDRLKQEIALLLQLLETQNDVIIRLRKRG